MFNGQRMRNSFLVELKNKIHFNAEFVPLLLILVFIQAVVLFDVAIDFREGVRLLHVLSELSIAFLVAIATFIVLKKLNYKYQMQIQKTAIAGEEAKQWKEKSSVFLHGLREKIDEELTLWNLSHSEKEIAYFLLKGFSTKEIAVYRNTAEKTVRAQAASIYAKSGLAGRSELSAYFLEDLLSPVEVARQ